jgi:hypothetical protein
MNALWRMGIALFLGSLSLLAADTTWPNVFQISINLNKLYYSRGQWSSLFLHGTHNVRVEIVGTDLQNPIWVDDGDKYLNNGALNVVVSDAGIDWVDVLLQNDVICRITINNDVFDTPFNYLPYAVLGQYAKRTKQFSHDEILWLDYANKRVVVHQSTAPYTLAVSGSVHADYWVGGGSQVTQLTGPGFSSGYSLNAPDGRHKQVVVAAESGNLGVHTQAPNGRMHIRGNIAFQGRSRETPLDYTIASGSVLLWDADRSAFRSGLFTESFGSNMVGSYSMGFGEDITVKAPYASVLGGKNAYVGELSDASIIVGGEGNRLYGKHSAIMGGFNQYVSGDFSVIVGGRDHTVYGPYTSVIGGKNNRVTGSLNTVLGQGITIVGDRNVAIGTHHIIDGNQSVALGDSVTVSQNRTWMYANDGVPTAASSNYSVVIMAKNGMGMNRLPVDGRTLSVRGVVQADRLVGDGRYLHHIIAGQDYWKQVIEANELMGIYYEGPISVGTRESLAPLTVSGGIRVGESAQRNTIANGTIQFTDQMGLVLFQDGWVSLDQVDTNQQLSAGNGIVMTDTHLTLAPGFLPGDTWIYGNEWVTTNRLVWETTDTNIRVNTPVIIGDGRTDWLSPLVVYSGQGSYNSPYPLLMIGGGQWRVSPRDGAILFNVATDGTGHIMTLTNNREGARLQGFGGRMGIQNGYWQFQQTESAHFTGEAVALRSFLNVSPTSAGTVDPLRATWHVDGSMGFQSTVLDYQAYPGWGHQLQRHASNPQYMMMDTLGWLTVNAGTDDQAGSTFFKLNNDIKAHITPAGDWVLGGADPARAKLSILGGGMALSANGRGIKTALMNWHLTGLRSVSGSEPLLQWRVDDRVMMGVGTKAVGIGRMPGASAVTMVSDDHPIMDIRSADGAARLTMMNEQHAYAIHHDAAGFWLRSDTTPLWHMDTSNYVGILREAVPNYAVAVGGSVGVTGAYWFQNASKENQMGLYRQNPATIIHHYNTEDPLAWATQTGDDVVKIHATAGVGLGRLPDADVGFDVEGPIRVNGSLYYSKNGINQLIQSFTIHDAASQVVNAVQTWVVDDASGLVLSADTQRITIQSPNLYNEWSVQLPDETVSAVKPNAKNDAIAFKQGPDNGVLIRWIDTNEDTIEDTIEFYNRLMDGGDINGTLTIQGDLSVEGVNADGSRVTDIPFYWQKNDANLYYNEGNVGIKTDDPSYPLAVEGTLRTTQAAISNTLYANALTLTANNRMDTVGGVSVILDPANQQDTESFGIQGSEPYMVIAGNRSNYTTGFFTDSPGSYVHVWNRSDYPGTVMAADGPSGLVLTRSDGASGRVQLNDVVPTWGRPNESIIQSSKRIAITTDNDPKVFIHKGESSGGLSIGKDIDTTTVYADESMVVGASFTQNALPENFAGLLVESGMSVGHNTGLSTGANFFSQDQLVIADTVPSELDMATFRGVLVDGRVGVGMVPGSAHGLTVSGNMSVLGTLWLQNAEGPYATIMPNEWRFHKGLAIHMSESMMVNTVNPDSKQPVQAMKITAESVILGTATSTDDTVHIDRDDENTILRLESTTDTLPRVHVKTSDYEAVLGMASMDTGTTRGYIQYGSNEPAMVIEKGGVGVGKNPDAGRALDVKDTLKAKALYKNGERLYPVPLGAIMMWSDTVGNIPNGWAVCDGQNGTPDLRNKFIKGASNLEKSDPPTSGKIGYIGGSNNGTVTSGAHTHMGGGHTHTINPDSTHAHGFSINNATLSGSTTIVRAPSYSLQQWVDKRRRTDGFAPVAVDHSHNYNDTHSHSHGSFSTNSTAGHNHTQSAQADGTHSHGGGAHTHTWQNNPSHYVLMFIMKVADV